METDISQQAVDTKKGKFRWSHVLLIILVTITLTAAMTWWALRTYLFAPDFKPVVLAQSESIKLNSKLKQLGYTPEKQNRQPGSAGSSEFNAQGNLKPERYTENTSNREVSFTERELNSLLANNTDLAKKVAVDLSDNLMSARMLVPVDQDFPLLGGKTLRFSSGLEVSYQDSRPVIVVKGVSIMGVPIPNAWLGGIKNIDLVKEFSVDQGFWKAFADGVDNIRVDNGKLTIKLKE